MSSTTKKAGKRRRPGRLVEPEIDRVAPPTVLFATGAPRGLRRIYSSNLLRSDEIVLRKTPVDSTNIESFEGFVESIGGDVKAIPLPRERVEYSVTITITCSPLAHERERFYRQMFDEQATQALKAHAASCYVYDAPPKEWPLAGWLFAAMDNWRSLASMYREKDPAAPPMQEEECLRAVSTAMAQRQIPQDEVVGHVNAERSRQGIEDDGLHVALYQDCYKQVDTIREIGRWLKKELTGRSQKDKRHEYLLRMVVNGETTSLNCPHAVPSPLAGVVDQPVPVGQRKPSCFKSDSSLREWVLEIAAGQRRLDHAAAQLYQLYDADFSQAQIRRLAAKIEQRD